MPHLHFRRTVYKSGGHKAVARLEYMSGRQVVQSEQAGRQLAYISNGREDLVAEGTRNLPAWARTAHEFFTAAEQYERPSPYDAQRRGIAFEEWKITLPHELSREQNLALVKDLLTMIAGNRLPYSYAFHNPQTLSGTQPQPHIHLLLSGRLTGTTDEYQRPVAQHFKRWNSKEPARGGAKKDPAMNHQGAIKAYRLMISDVVNLHLEQHGHVARVHPDSLKSRGIDRGPEPKLLPSESAAYRTNGVVSPALATVLAIRQARATQPPREQNNARQYWEKRKAFLGITRDMPHDQKLAHILLTRHGTVERVPVRYRRLLQPSRVQGRTPERVSSFQRLTRVLVAQLEDTRAQGRLRVRLHEPDRDQGMGL